MDNRNKEIKTLTKSIQYVLVFAIIFFSNDTTLFGTNRNQAFVSYGFLIDGLLIFLFVLLFAARHNGRITIHKRMIELVMLMSACIVMSAIVNQDFRGGYATSILLILFGYIVTQFIPATDFGVVYANLFQLLAGCSIIGKILLDKMPGLYNLGFYVQRSTGLEFRHFLLYARSTEGQAGARNYSIFREPGVFQAYLVAALVISILLFDQNKKKWKSCGIAVLIIAIFMTKSTTGYFALCLVFLFYLIRRDYFKNRKKLGFLVAGSMCMILAMGLYFHFFISDVTKAELRYIFLDKFDSSSASFESGFARIASIGTNLSLWLMNPVFGVGVTKKQAGYLEASMRVYGYQTSIDTNSVIAQFSLYGFVIGVLWILAVIGLTKRVSKKRSEKVIVFLLIMMLLMTEYLVYSSLCNIFIWYGLRTYFLKEGSEAAAIRDKRMTAFGVYGE